MPNFDNFDDKKRKFLEAYSTKVITKEKAARSAGYTRQTIWNWQQNDPEFDEAVKQAKEKQEEMRLEAVEDSVFKQIMEGKAAASVIIFVLKNLGKGKWLDSHQIEGKHEIEHKGGLTLTELHEKIQEDADN